MTTWIGLLEQGQDDAAQKLWERYFPKLVRLARSKLGARPRAVGDEEDVALSAFHAFCQAAAKNKIPRLVGRDDLWRTLVLITSGKAVDQQRREMSKKRGGGGIGGSHAQAWDRQTAEMLEELVGNEPDPAFAAQVAEQFALLMDALPDDQLRQIACLKLEGADNDEIAERLETSPRTVSRRLSVIRRTWQAAGDEDGGER